MGAHKLKVVTPRTDLKNGDPAQGFDVEVYLDDKKLDGICNLSINIEAGSKVVKAILTVAVSDLEYDLRTHVDIQDLDENPATLKAVTDFQELQSKKNQAGPPFFMVHSPVETQSTNPKVAEENLESSVNSSLNAASL